MESRGDCYRQPTEAERQQLLADLDSSSSATISRPNSSVEEEDRHLPRDSGPKTQRFPLQPTLDDNFTLNVSVANPANVSSLEASGHSLRVPPGFEGHVGALNTFQNLGNTHSITPTSEPLGTQVIDGLAPRLLHPGPSLAEAESKPSTEKLSDALRDPGMQGLLKARKPEAPPTKAPTVESKDEAKVSKEACGRVDSKDKLRSMLDGAIDSDWADAKELTFEDIKNISANNGPQGYTYTLFNTKSPMYGVPESVTAANQRPGTNAPPIGETFPKVTPQTVEIKPPSGEFTIHALSTSRVGAEVPEVDKSQLRQAVRFFRKTKRQPPPKPPLNTVTNLQIPSSRPPVDRLYGERPFPELSSNFIQAPIADPEAMTMPWRPQKPDEQPNWIGIAGVGTYYTVPWELDPSHKSYVPLTPSAPKDTCSGDKEALKPESTLEVKAMPEGLANWGPLDTEARRKIEEELLRAWSYPWPPAPDSNSADSSDNPQSELPPDATEVHLNNLMTELDPRYFFPKPKTQDRLRLEEVAKGSIEAKRRAEEREEERKLAVEVCAEYEEKLKEAERKKEQEEARRNEQLLEDTVKPRGRLGKFPDDRRLESWQSGCDLPRTVSADRLSYPINPVAWEPLTVDPIEREIYKTPKKDPSRNCHSELCIYAQSLRSGINKRSQEPKYVRKCKSYPNSQTMTTKPMFEFAGLCSNCQATEEKRAQEAEESKEAANKNLEEAKDAAQNEAAKGKKATDRFKERKIKPMPKPRCRYPLVESQREELETDSDSSSAGSMTCHDPKPKHPKNQEKDSVLRMRAYRERRRAQIKREQLRRKGRAKQPLKPLDQGVALGETQDPPSDVNADHERRPVEYDTDLARLAVVRNAEAEFLRDYETVCDKRNQYAGEKAEALPPGKALREEANCTTSGIQIEPNTSTLKHHQSIVNKAKPKPYMLGDIIMRRLNGDPEVSKSTGASSSNSSTDSILSGIDGTEKSSPRHGPQRSMTERRRRRLKVGRLIEPGHCASNYEDCSCFACMHKLRVKPGEVFLWKMRVESISPRLWHQLTIFYKSQRKFRNLGSLAVEEMVASALIRMENTGTSIRNMDEHRFKTIFKNFMHSLLTAKV
ncbi:hypothetical protein TWF696_009439 [Orbilia brochopaga]|uniref:Uncharacterized protein n=1 Tax=Orbilia brochopaga TaxID=3140254 RepID=A0AAV9UET4_9PEZI